MIGGNGRGWEIWRDRAARRQQEIALLLLFLSTVPMLTKIFTSDYGTHLAIGREILRTKSIPLKEFLNYTSLGIPINNHEWGFQAILHLVHSAGGDYGVSVLCWAVTGAIFFLLFRASVIRGAHPILAVAAIFAFSGFLRIRIQPRPEIFTYLFASTTIWLFSSFYSGKSRRAVYLYPLLMLVWGNIHGSFLLGLLLWGVFFLDAAVRAAWNRNLRWAALKEWVVPAGIVFLGGIVASGLNPLGYAELFSPLHLITRGTGAGGGGGHVSSVLMSISELTPVRMTGFYTYYKAACLFMAFSVILGLIGKRIYFLDICLFVAALKGGWESARAVSMMGLFIAPGAAVQMSGFLDRAFRWIEDRALKPVPSQSGPDQRKRKNRRPGKGELSREASPKTHAASPVPGRYRVKFVLSMALVACLLSFGGTVLSFSARQLEFGIGMTEHKFSFKAADFLRKNPVPGNMFNFFDVGGFLDWQLYPGTLTFIDGRAINKDVFMEHQLVTAAMAGWRQVIEKHEIRYVVTKGIDSSGTILPLVNALALDGEWHLVFADGLFLIYVKGSPETREYIGRHEISKDLIYSHLMWEAYHYTFLGVAPGISYYTMASMMEMMGNRSGAIELLRRYLTEHSDPFLQARLAELERRGAHPR